MADASTTWPRPATYDFHGTLRFQRIGHRDPTLQLRERDVFRAWRTLEGPATVHARDCGDRIRVQAWGPGASSAVEQSFRLLGLHDDPAVFQPDHPRLARLADVHRGIHLSDCGDVVGSLVRVTLQQLWTWQEAVATWQHLVRHHGEDAPGPLPLRLIPAADVLARLPTWAYERAGLSERRARTVIGIGRHAARLAEAYAMDRPARLERLQVLPGLGPWTAESVLGMHLGDPDALPPGDVHLPRTLRYALTGEDRDTSDDEMFAFAEPFRPQRFRLMRLVYAAGITPPRTGPKREVRWGRG